MLSRSAGGTLCQMSTRRWSKMCTRSQDKEGAHPTTRRQWLLASLGNGGLSEVAEEIPPVFRHVRKIGKTTGECLEWNMKEGIGVQELVAGVPSASSVELVLVQPSKCVEGRQEHAFQEFVCGGGQEETSGQGHNQLDLVSVKGTEHRPSGEGRHGPNRRA